MTEVFSSNAPDNDVELQLSLPALFIGDLIAYEFLDLTTRAWRCELATIVGSTTSRTVQIERLTQDVQALDDGIVASTETGKRILAELQEKQKEYAARVEGLKQFEEQIREKRDAISRKRMKVKDEVERARQELGDACAGVAKIDSRQWRELVSYRNPPDPVVRVVSAVMMIMDERSNSWADMQPVLHRQNFLQQLANFEPTDANLKQRNEVIRRYTSTRFTYQEAVKGSQAVGQLYRWVMANVRVLDASEIYQEINNGPAEESSEIERLEVELGQRRASIADFSEDIGTMWERFNNVERDNEVSPVQSVGSVAFTDETEDSYNKPHANAPRRSVTGASADPNAYTEVMRRLTTRPWRYSRTNEQRIILHSSVLCNFGPAPPKTSCINLTREQCQQLHAAALARQHQESPIASERIISVIQDDSVYVQNTNVKSAKESHERHQERTEGDGSLENIFSTDLKYTKQHDPQQLHRNENARAALERQLKESEEVKADLERKLQETTETESSTDRQLRESEEARAALERQLKESEEAMADLERKLQENAETESSTDRRLRESEEARAALERQLKESEEVKADLERKLQETTETESSTDRQLRESENVKQRLEARIEELERLCSSYESNTPVALTDEVYSRAPKLTGNGRDSHSSPSGKGAAGRVLPGVRNALLRVENDINDCSENISRMISDDKVAMNLNLLLNFTGEESQSGRGSGSTTSVASAKVLYSLAREFKREVLRRTVVLFRREKEVRTLRSKLDALHEELSSIEKSIVKQQQEYKLNFPEDTQLLKELQEKQQILVEKLSVVEQKLTGMRELQVQRQQEFLRRLQHYSPGLVEAYMQKTFVSEWWETGAFSVAVGTFLSFAVGSLLYKKYELC